MIGLAAFALAPLALGFAVGQWTSRQAEANHPPAGTFAEIEGVSLHYTDSGPPGLVGTGAGRPLILLHGASTSLLDMEASIAPLLAAHHRVIAVDRPGHGYSERPTGDWPDPGVQARLFHGLAAHLGLVSPVIVGHSWAGSVVTAYLLDFPDEASGGVLLAGASHPWQGGAAWYNELAGVPALGGLFARTVVGSLGPALLDGGIRGAMAPEPVPADYRRRTGVDLSLRPGAFLANAEDIRRLSDFLEIQQHRYPTLRPPLLLIIGDQDTIVPPWNHRDRLLRTLPDIDSVVFAGAGHGLHHSHPQAIAGLISALASKRSPEPRPD